MEQTNRTILFEEINPNKGSFLTFIQDEMPESISDNTLQQINSYLEVASFEECLQKFEPTIFLCFDSEKKQVFCTLNEDEISYGRYEVCRIKINIEYPLLRYYIDLLEQKVNQVCDLDIKLLKLMFPINSASEFLEEYMKIASRYVDGNRKDITKKLTDFLEKYDNVLSLLYILFCVAGNELARKDEVSQKIILSDKKYMQVKEDKVSANFIDRHINISDTEIHEYEEWLTRNLSNTEHQELYRQIFNVVIKGKDLDLEELQYIYYESLDFLIIIIECFWNICRPQLEGLLGIYNYFAQYKIDSKGMIPKLLVTNFKPSDINDVKNREKLKLFLNSTNEKINGENIYWYAFIPHMEYKNDENGVEVRERFKGNTKAFGGEFVSRENAKEIIHILAEHKIQTFVSPITGQYSNAAWVMLNGVDEWVQYQSGFSQRDTSEYVYPCFPNFSLYANSHTEIKLENKSNWEDIRVNKTGRKQLWIKNLAIEASYVAAGIYASVQCPVFLGKHFPNRIEPNNPGVGFRLIESNGNKKIHSILKAGNFPYSKEIMDDIYRKAAGVFFAPLGNKMIIAKDSAMSELYGLLNSVSTVQTLTYVERQLRYETQDFKAELIEQFFQRRPGSLMSKWNQNREYYNSILKHGESIQYELNKEQRECLLEISFNEIKYQRPIRLN